MTKGDVVWVSIGFKAASCFDVVGEVIAVREDMCAVRLDRTAGAPNNVIHLVPKELLTRG